MIDAVAVVVVVAAHSRRGPGKRAGHHRTELQAAATSAKESGASLKFRSNGVKIEDTRTHANLTDLVVVNAGRRGTSAPDSPATCSRRGFLLQTGS